MPNMTRNDFKDRIVLHNQSVKLGLQRVCDILEAKGLIHDEDKFFEDEFELFYQATDKFAQTDFGSSEYHEALSLIQPALKLHYARNSHHPDHYENGVNGMNLLDMIEMLIDWKKASCAYGKTSFQESMEINKKRFKIDEQTFGILLNTARELGYLE